MNKGVLSDNMYISYTFKKILFINVTMYCKITYL